ncbi:MAG TPA: hypothetical protein VF008_14235 [Niastella sp.]
MKPQHLHQEVLIFTTTSLSQRTLYRKNSSNKDSSAIEELEEAFWDGLLNELVPEIVPSIRQPKMVIWGIHAGNFCLFIDLADNPGTIESNNEAVLSINPHLLSSEINMN